MRYEAQDFARCNGNPCFEYCKECRRNLKNSPVHPEATHQWYMGPWVVEDERCPSYLDNERFSPTENHAKTNDEAGVSDMRSMDSSG